MTIIADIYDKIGAVLKKMQADPATRVKSSFSTDDVYALYIKQYPGDEEVMEARQRNEPTSHALKGYLNGMVNQYAKKADGRDPDRPAIQFLSEMTYCFVDGK